MDPPAHPMDIPLQEMNSMQFLDLMNCTSKASALPPPELCWEPGDKWPDTLVEKDSMLRRHTSQRRRAQCAACCTREERATVVARLEAEEMAALRLLNPAVYQEA